MWEYAALFDVPAKPTALELAMNDPDWWEKKGCALRVGQMGYRTNTIKAGDILVAEIFPVWGRETKKDAKRAKRQHMTAERVQKYNTARAKFRLELLLDTNFGQGDLNVTLTYTDAPREADARKDVKNFIDRVRRARARKGLPPLKYVYALEDERDGRAKQLHCHIVMSGGIDRHEVEAIWRKGSKAKGVANADEVQPFNDGLRRLAFYIYDQNRGKAREPGTRHYSCSKNLTEPKRRESMSRVTNAKVKKLALDFNGVAKDIMEKVYPGYTFVRGLKYQGDEPGSMSESCVRFSDYTSGVYIRVMMRKNQGGKRG